MGLIKEPKGVDLFVGPSELTDKDRRAISAIIVEYKKTGKMPVVSAKTRVPKRRVKLGGKVKASL